MPSTRATKSGQPKKRTAPINTSAGLKIIGIFFILISLFIAFQVPCPTKVEVFIIYTLVGLGTALLLFRSASKSVLTFKVGGLSFSLTGGVVMTFALYIIKPIDKIKSNECDKKVTVSVFVHGKKGKQDLVLKGQGYVVMDINGGRIPEPINEKGQAVFHNLDIGQKVRLDIDFSEPYKPIQSDTEYIIDRSERIYLPVALQGIDKVQGAVTYKEQPLPGVIVRIEELLDTTDALGAFVFSIPEAQQRKEYEVWFIKTGFKSKSVIAYPQTGQSLNIVMEK